ncbi:hypothetical protein [Eudoraea chungangensis]|uniref:hypothetical protein n=1 Tax=Eudoraea chungangensis TaxID=1481905 RepID=UPI0023EA907B|nr:hypothetical protein [Eudoraea chungangensis]
MIKKTLIFLIVLAGALLTTIFFHLAIFYAWNLPIKPEVFIICYLGNLLMAFIIYLSMLLLAKNYGKYLGFIFLFGSIFKFAVFFAIIQPVLLQDGTVGRARFFVFFIPYLVSLFVETYALVKLLREQES